MTTTLTTKDFKIVSIESRQKDVIAKLVGPGLVDAFITVQSEAMVIRIMKMMQAIFDTGVAVDAVKQVSDGEARYRDGYEAGANDIRLLMSQSVNAVCSHCGNRTPAQIRSMGEIDGVNESLWSKVKRMEEKREEKE